MLGNGDVVITGVGLIGSLGDSAGELHDGLAAGTVAIGDPAWPLPSGMTAFFAGVHGFDPTEHIGGKVVHGTDRFAQFALVAAGRALADAGLETVDPMRTGVVIGTAMGGLTSLVEGQHALDEQGIDAVNPKLQIKIWPNMAAAQITMRYGLHGPSLTMCTACASSLDAIGNAARLVQLGAADVMLAGGAEGRGPLDFAPVHVVGQKAMGMLPKETDPFLASRPFDRDRSGIANGEGSALFVLERRDHAEARGARVLGSVRGYASLAEGYHPSSPDPTGQWEAETMRRAMADAGLGPDGIDAIYAHATGTPKGDASEIVAINDVFGARASEVSVTSLKGNIGHTGGAAGSMNLAAALQGIEHGAVVPTAGTTTPDPAIRFGLCLGRPAERTLRAVVINAFGFGGQDASLVVTAPA
jgi:3-oxoacyl-[acyl-carrier-protein] synthase II